MSSSLTQFAYAAGLDLNVMDSGGQFSPQQLLDIRDKANRIIDNWNSDQLQIPYMARNGFPITANQSFYTVGFALNWSFTFIPRKFVAATHLISAGAGTISEPVEIVDAVKWAAIPDRLAPGNKIRYLYYNRGLAQSVNASAFVSPVPISNGQMEVQYWDANAFLSFPDVTTPIAFYPGYELPFQLELAIQIAPMFETQPSQDLLDRYNGAMNILRKLNADLWGIESLAPETAAVKATE